MSAAREQLAELISRLREQCQWKTDMPCANDPPNQRCVSCRAADALETFAASVRAPQSGPGLYGFLAVQGDLLAQHIRTVDGSNSMGAGALAERLVECGWRFAVDRGAGRGAGHPVVEP